MGGLKVSREPALILALFAAIVQVVSVFVFDWTPDQQATLNAAAVALAGVLTSFWVKSDSLAPSVLGFTQSALACALGFGLQIAPEGQAAVMAVVGALTAMFIRTQVVAPVGPTGVPVLTQGPVMSGPTDAPTDAPA